MHGLVPTALGRVQGSVHTVRGRRVAWYRGVPYGTAPLGGRRWEPAVPPQRWSVTRDATAAAPAPPQLPDPLAVLPGLRVDATSEDSLTVDVCAPVGGRGRPVMVWLPGGGFTTGGTAPPTYDPRPLSAQGDVVVVAVNYRLGIVGFSALGPVANLGLRDQLAALEWVQRHIADFGGDPGCVTVFGESAGGGSIMHLLSSPLRAGLFHRAIVQSGATDLTLSKTQAERVADRLRAALGGADLAGTGIDDLLAVQADTITGLVAEVGGLPFHPWVDGDVVSDRPLNALRDGCAAGVPLLIGTTTDELRLFVDTAEQGLTDDRLRHRLVRYLAARGRSDDATVDRILSAHATDQPSLTTAECWAAIRTEAEMRAPMVAAAEAQSAHAPTFVYEFTWPAIGAFARLGACHALDLPFTFGTVGVDGWPACVGRGPAPAKVSAALRAAWVSFATTGDPSHEAIGAWPAYEPVRRTTMELGRQRQIHDDPRAATRRAWAATRTSD